MFANKYFIIDRNPNNVVKWNYIFYLITFFYSMLIGVVLVPLYLKFIPSNVYGLWLATGNVLTFLTIVDPGFSGVLQQKISYNYGKGNIKLVGEYALTGSIIAFLFVILVAVFGFLLYFNFSKIVPISIDLESFLSIKKAFLFSLIGTLLMLMYYTVGAIDYGILSSKAIGLINQFGNFGSMLSIIYFLNNGHGVVSLGYSSVIRGSIYLLLSVTYTIFRFHHEKIKLNFNFKGLSEFKSHMGYNFLGKIGLNMVSQINSYVSAIMINPHSATILKFSQTVPEMSKLLVTRIANSFAPILPNLQGKGDTDLLNHFISKLIFMAIYLLGIILIGFIMLNRSFVSLWVGESYFAGNLLNVLIVVLVVISIFSEVCSQIIFSLGYIKKNSLAYFILGIIYIPTVFLLSKKFGLYGIVISGLISYFVTTFWFFPYTLIKVAKIQFENVKLFGFEITKILVVGLFIYIVSYYVSFPDKSWLFFIIRALLIIIQYIILMSIFSKKFRSLIFRKKVD